MTRIIMALVLGLGLLGGCSGLPPGDPEAAERWQKSIQPDPNT